MPTQMLTKDDWRCRNEHPWIILQVCWLSQSERRAQSRSGASSQGDVCVVESAKTGWDGVFVNWFLSFLYDSSYGAIPPRVMAQFSPFNFASAPEQDERITKNWCRQEELCKHHKSESATWEFGCQDQIFEDRAVSAFTFRAWVYLFLLDVWQFCSFFARGFESSRLLLWCLEPLGELVFAEVPWSSNFSRKRSRRECFAWRYQDHGCSSKDDGWDHQTLYIQQCKQYGGKVSEGLVLCGKVLDVLYLFCLFLSCFASAFGFHALTRSWETSAPSQSWWISVM